MLSINNAFLFDHENEKRSIKQYRNKNRKEEKSFLLSPAFNLFGISIFEQGKLNYYTFFSFGSRKSRLNTTREKSKNTKSI